MNPTLVILAAGMGSRYGGLKQMDGVGPNSETIMDYSVYDAIKAGFGKVVFVIREDFAADFKDKVSNKFTQAIEVVHVFQSLDSGIEGLSCPAHRVKPWGTGHALLVARDFVTEPFAVINADDYYGQDAFQQAFSFLSGLNDSSLGSMVGYPLENTLSDNGYVNRGICQMDENYFLIDVVEREKITSEDGIIGYPDKDENHVELSRDSIASMNFWLFHPGIFEDLAEGFNLFLQSHRMTPKSEFYIPFFVDACIKSETLQIVVLSSDDPWQGVTYREDAEIVRQEMKKMHQVGKYPTVLRFEGKL